MSVKSKNLQELMDLIGSKYIFNQENYPNMDDSVHETKMMFAIKHSSFHMQKSLGKIAEVCEEYDHRGARTHKTFNQTEEAVVKMFVNTLKLAEEIGMSADNLFESVEKFYEK